MSLQHTDILVTRSRCYLHHIQTLLKEPAGSLVPKIVEVEVLYPRPFARPAPEAS